MSEKAAFEQREVYYSGWVQGVGFRYTVRRIATRYAVTGFVRNLSDGRVQLVAEGRPEELRRFLDAVDAEMGRYIANTQEKAGPVTDRYQGFEIRF